MNEINTFLLFSAICSAAIGYLLGSVTGYVWGRKDARQAYDFAKSYDMDGSSKGPGTQAYTGHYKGPTTL